MAVAGRVHGPVHATAFLLRNGSFAGRKHDSDRPREAGTPGRVTYVIEPSPYAGRNPLLGRLLLPDEDKPGKPQVAILSFATWNRLFGADPHVIGKSITLNGKQYAVAGALGKEFKLNHEVMQTVGATDVIDVYLPLPLGADAVRRRGDENYNVTVRLKPGVSNQQAQADVDVIASRIRQQDKRDHTFGMTVMPLLD
ncbi:MAG: ABC transporter permease [Acidobacteriaceae bacterium]|nr:ABC transporter permease [Acidobacteriaceae bacterium]